MTTPTPHFIPATERFGGSRVGITYLGTRAGCRRKWFFRYGFPELTKLHNGWAASDAAFLGLAPFHTDPNLLKGSTFHEALAAWYRSGVHGGYDTGAHNLDLALDTLAAQHQQRINEWEEPADAEAALSSLRAMMTAYHGRYDVTGSKPDFPMISVYVNDQGEPLIEKEYEIPLGNGYVMTCRVDLVTVYRGDPAATEHKTSGATAVNGRLESAQTDPQATVELMGVRTEVPEARGVLYNVIVKDRAAKSRFDVAERIWVTRSEADFRAVTTGCRTALEEINRDISRVRELLPKAKLFDILDLVAPEDGKLNGYCRSYNRKCEFWDICTNRGHEFQMLPGFRQRTNSENTRDMEYPK